MNKTSMSKPVLERPSWNPYLGGIVLGTVLFLSYVLTHAGLGASGGFYRVVAWLLDQIAPHHVDVTPDFAKIAGGFKNPLNDRMFWMVIGVGLGGFLSGLIGGRLKFETQKGPRVRHNATRWLFALLGGMISGYGARLARGCTSGQALSGGAVLAVGSWVFMFAVFAGGYLLAYPVRRLWT